MKRILTAILLFPTLLYAQINTERVMTIARNALYFEDYVLSIQYFNQVINAKPYLFEPYFFRGLAKINLDDYQGAEADCDEAIRRNIQGTVYVSATIDRNGAMTAATVQRSVDPLLDAEALRVVRLLKEWTPATREGEAVEMNVLIPVRFQLQ